LQFLTDAMWLETIGQSLIQGLQAVCVLHFSSDEVTPLLPSIPSAPSSLSYLTQKAVDS